MPRASAQDAFRRITTLIASGNRLPVVLEAIVRAVEADRPDIMCSIQLLDPDGRHLTLGAAPSLPDAFNQAIEGLAIGPAVGSCGSAAFHNARVIVEDIGSDPLWVDHWHLAQAAELAACWSQPIRSPDGAVLGTFAIYHRCPSTPNQDDIVFIEAAADLAAIAIGRQRDEESLAVSEARASAAADVAQDHARNLKTFFDVSLDLLSIADLEGRFVDISPMWETALGYPVAALIGTPYLDLVHPDDVEPTRVHMGRLAKAEEVLNYVNRYRRRDGAYRMLEWRARLSGELVFAVARDVTERLLDEARMAAVKEAALAANQAKSDFLANMSHEIRTPLNGVIGVVAALGETPLTPSQREMVELIQSSGETLERLVSDILDVSKIEAGHLTIEERSFDLAATLDSLLEMTRLRAQEKALAFRIDRGANAHGAFRGDGIRIRQVLGNLLSNALKFTSHGEVAVLLDVVDPAVPGDPSRLILEVSDTGVGFDPALSTLLFQRFSQADTTITRRFGGTGLGLSICKTLVEMMGGQIVAHSQQGRGSLFRVEIPLVRVLAPLDAEAPSSPVRIDGAWNDRSGALRVLLAEDHPVNQKVVQLILAPYAAEVTVVENGAQAVDAFKAGRYDVVLMDMQMPVMDGLAATRAIRGFEQGAAGRGRTPIVVLSANAMAHHQEDALTAGADLHIAKPITAAGLIAGIGQALEAGRQSLH